ncbi:hypothetical protein BDM02DRAFT_3124171 [Thelephora ganbajun]|uniref:Uncharacterized protein n=1 Tax=Thelephora ganbajun TaxID=370292 RepID=A0ACB6Z058_THEGA|nr:hypothetical protein BDM02DRAFT_3124171 [Thelephora ganbajun]
MERRKELTRHAHRSFTTLTLVDGLRRALEEIEKRSQKLLAKGTGVRFIDKDSGEVARLVERLREAITHYQVSKECFAATNGTHAGSQLSQKQAIYKQITNLTSSLDTLLKLHEVTHFSKLAAMFVDTWTEITSGQK